MSVRKRINTKASALVFITTTVKNWIPIFRNKNIALIVLDQLRESAEYLNISIVGYVLMPSHLHALLGFKDIAMLSRFMQSFKSISSRKLKGVLSQNTKRKFLERGKFRLWQPRFDDLLIETKKQFKIKLEYIHKNPVNAGLAKNAVDWEFSSASDWLKDSPDILKVDKEFSYLE